MTSGEVLRVRAAMKPISTIPRALKTIDTATQTFQLKTTGWNWLYGGGAEGWFTTKFGVYGEIGYARVAGDASVGTIGRLDDRLTYLLFGARLRIGG